MNRQLFAVVVGGALAMTLTACSVDVHEDRVGDRARVDIRTPMGGVLVRTNVDSPETGLAVYPGAHAHRQGRDPENANVNVASSMFGVRLTAAKFLSDDPPVKIVEFYKNEMHRYGDVLECKGNVDFTRRGGLRRPVCKEKWRSHETQLVVGTEHQHRIVAVKPHPGGTEFAVVYLETRGQQAERE
jgi:hypothetical protein